ncbi:MAG: putative CRISPR-associated protein [candidate division WOR-3 bacterium]|nr:putative CRISPR-associated protein [candidate division WOR-3 bacterium]MDW8113635.1 putative CRISPR-associated protein [candidate division WOR-3 bacterium]
MKEFHIISSGVSLIQNAQRRGVLPEDIKIRDESYWKEILNNSKEVNKLYSFLKENPKENSAELNTFLRVVENKEPSNISVYLFGTNTASNQLCRKVIEKFLEEENYKIYPPSEVSGYFYEAEIFDENYAKDEFQKDISLLLDRLISIAKRKKEEGYKVYFNPTGGFKAYVMVTALAGFLLNCEIYYMHEEFNRTIFLPPLFYLPKGKEIELLEQLKDRKPRSGGEYERILQKFPQEIERLKLYQLVEVERDEETGKEYRIKITEKGVFILEELKKI